MDDPSANQTPGESFNKIDLSALEAFQFGTQWTDTGDSKRSSSSSSAPGDRSRGGEGGAGPARRDRRPPRPQGERDPGYHAEAPHTEHSEAGAYARDRGGPRAGGDRYESGGRFDRRPRFDRGSGGGQGGFRPDRDRGESRFDRGDQRDRGMRRPMGPPRPYISPVFEVTFYPDDHGFTALVKAMRASCRTYELFEIARLILGKPERCVVVFRRRVETPGATPPPLAISVPSGLPFETEDEAVNYALEHNLDQFFSTESVEVEPPKGSFQFVNRCPITKDLLGPPNYHRYPHILQQHYTTRGIRMPFEKYKASIEVVRDPEAINQWLESMKKATRYTIRPEFAAVTAPGEPTSFDNLEDARAYLLRTCRERLVRTSETARVAARVVEGVTQLEVFRAMHGALEMQRRFPLDTANALRGRLRRENFNIFKRGSKGVTYVCSVRRKFRQPGQVFSESIDRLIAFLDANPMVNVAELPLKFLGFAVAAAPNTTATTGAVEVKVADEAATAPAAPAAVATATEPATAPTGLTPEQKVELNRLMLDLRWLVTEGYVAEYSDGKLFAHPVVTPQAEAQHEKSEQSAEAGDGNSSESTEADPGQTPIDPASAVSASPEIVGGGEPEASGSAETPPEETGPQTESSAANQTS